MLEQPQNPRWLEVDSQLPKLWMYLGCIVLRRSIQKAAVQVFVSNVAIWPIFAYRTAT
jgi:hypothetical protein